MHCNGILWGILFTLWTRLLTKLKFIFEIHLKLGDLRYFISEKSFKNGSSADYYLTNNQVKLEWSIELFEGLFYIHSEKIIHRDINPK